MSVDYTGGVAGRNPAWVKALEHHFGRPPGSVTTKWQGFEVLTEAGYTTADCDACKETVAGDVDPEQVARVLDSHACVQVGAAS